MKYLLDVNALLALGIGEHEFHDRVANWVVNLASSSDLEIVTCSITELGFVRIVAQTALHGYTVEDAKGLLKQLKSKHSEMLSFLADAQDITHLPSWVQYPKQVTDGHLVRFGKSNGAVPATVGWGILGALSIPS